MSEEKWTVRKILSWTSSFFESKQVPSPRLNAELLLADVLGLAARLDLLMDPERELSAEERTRFRAYVARRVEREPTPHIIGSWAFYKRDYSLNFEVLTPRSETELLVDRALGWARENNTTLAADIGTGSGCLAITMALELPELRVLASDISSAALSVAQSNAQKHGVEGRIEFLEGDLLEPFLSLKGVSGKIDLIVSNPPYIASGAIDSLMPEVAGYEPRVALDGGEDGLDFYRCLVPGCVEMLRPGGALIFEIGDGQAEAVTSLLEVAQAYENIEVTKDLAALERIVFACRKS